MIKKLKGKMRKAIMGLALLTELSTPDIKAEGWANIQPAYDTKAKHATVKLEGGTKIADNVSTYGFLHLDATKEKPTDLENFYGELRTAYSVTDILGLAAEYNGGNGTEDTIRLGITITPNLGKNNFTMLKFFPYETSEKKGPQWGLFTSQKLTDRIGASLLLDYNTNNRTLYVEPQISVELTKKLTGFLQGRHFGSIDDKIELAPIIGLKYDF
jgi:hypothetical protein